MIKEYVECDKAMKDYFSGFTLERSGSNIVVPVKFLKPQSQFVTSDYPIITLMQAGDYPDNSRWDNNVIVTNPVYENGRLVARDVRDYPEPLNIYYSLRIYTISQREGEKIKTFLRSKLKRCAYLTLRGDITPLEQISYRNPNSTSSDYAEVKKDENNELIYQYLLKVETRIDLDSPVTIRTAQQLVLGTNNI